jgi:hypothetical protein
MSVAPLVELRVAAHPILPRLDEKYAVEYTGEDAAKLGRRAIETNAWQYLADFGHEDAWRGGRRARETLTETVVAIAAPDGRVAIWYGRRQSSWITMQNAAHAALMAPITNKFTPNEEAARIVTESYGDPRSELTRALMLKAPIDVVRACDAAVLLWDPKKTKGGPRDVKPLAQAACRVLHAIAFEVPFDVRDQYTYELLILRGGMRPPTNVIVSASDETLAAASALLMIRNWRQTRALLLNAHKHSQAKP